MSSVSGAPTFPWNPNWQPPTNTQPPQPQAQPNPEPQPNNPNPPPNHIRPLSSRSHKVSGNVFQKITSVFEVSL
ncbi:uncharacterized protein FA14DRAFT_178364 [Meira miltonrushii]|uniref:Uncharacterized protein n=1 Tax=Meira miltonrushii TaxID=1280837 RepID=A0A316VHJ7_9BASI|nr:uncharacterized protein FA14DRAFT_178364 [Meira miltonrushii]PWN34975.1 hypothetical protein FA14DRAFT_178364 [Meira miltonrushii]